MFYGCVSECTLRMHTSVIVRQDALAEDGARATPRPQRLSAFLLHEIL